MEAEVAVDDAAKEAEVFCLIPAEPESPVKRNVTGRRSDGRER